MKICLIRLDKIGDLVCTLPVDEVPWLDGHQIRWVIAQGLGFVAASAVPGRRFLQLNKNTKLHSFLALNKFLKDEKFDVAVSFQGPWWVSLALWLQNVPVRAGVKSQWHSFLFFNRGLRQRRSLGAKHEADYNLELLAHALKKNANELPVAADGTRAPVLRLRAPEHPDVQKRLALTHDSYVVVHPGMAGSALNWPQKNYVSLIRELTRMTKVVITGTPADEPWLGEIRLGLQGLDQVTWLVGEVTPAELLGVLNESRLVIAPSTGVAHLAAALGKPVVSFFSPLKVQSPVRWAPRSRVGKITCLVPDAPQMEKITLEESLRAIARSLS